MTDVLPRLDGAFDGSDRRTLDRRQLLRAGAWAAPVLVLATASPAMANATSGTAIPTTSNLNLEFSNFSVWKATSGVKLKEAPWYYAAFDGIEGNTQVGFNYIDPAVVVTTIYLEISVPKQGMSTTKATVHDKSRAGWVAEQPATTDTSIIYKFTWTGTLLSNTGDRYAQLYFTLPGDHSNVTTVGLPKSLTVLTTSPQANPTSTGGTVS